MPSALTVHVLRNGEALCGKVGMPKDWEDDHRWVSFLDRENFRAVNCVACRAALEASLQTLGGDK